LINKNIALNYNDSIELLIRADKLFEDTEIKNLKCEACSNYYHEKLDEIFELAKNENFEEIKHKFSSTPKTFDDLLFFSFSDQNNKKYVIIVYDSDELWQDPELLKIMET
jgi:hypothetical protein